MSRGAAGSPLVAPIGTAFVIGKTPANEALLVTAGDNIPETTVQSESNLVTFLPKRSATAESIDL
jgi:hypothetical protein